MKSSVSLRAAPHFRWASKASRAVSIHSGIKVAVEPDVGEAGIARYINVRIDSLLTLSVARYMRSISEMFKFDDMNTCVFSPMLARSIIARLRVHLPQMVPRRSISSQRPIAAHARPDDLPAVAMPPDYISIGRLCSG